MILITGAHKAFALYKAIEEGVNHMWTVSAFQQHPKTLFICDEDATLELRVKTVKYFKVGLYFPFCFSFTCSCPNFMLYYLHNTKFIYKITSH
jgi:hypothetical protein